MYLIIFDLGNVILRYDFRRFAEKVSKGTNRTTQEVIEHLCFGGVKNDFDTGRLAIQDFVSYALKWLQHPNLSRDAFVEYWQDIFWEDPSAEQILNEVRMRYPIWLMSDTDPLHFTHALNRFPVLKRFEVYFLSFISGYLKRETDSFKRVLDVANGFNKQIIYIDDIEVNIRSACSTGLTGILFSSWSKLRHDLSQYGIL